jgi:Fungal Zn(2)-Cys(6) binuclear cluster domain
MGLVRTRNDNHDHGKSPLQKISSSSQPSPNQMLKSTCDICAKLKVSCPKQQPHCEWCLSKGLQCLYSSARMYGKKKRVEKQKADNHASRFFLPASEKIPLVPWQTAQPIEDVNNDHGYYQPPSRNNGITLLETPTTDKGSQIPDSMASYICRNIRGLPDCYLQGCSRLVECAARPVGRSVEERARE